MMHVFVSRPTWVLDEYKNGLDNFLCFLEEIGLKPRTLGVSDFPVKSPLDEVLAMFEQCDGTIVLGYPQIKIDIGYIKDKPVNGVYMATEWNHIEAGLAYAKNLPLLIIGHEENVSRGIFDKGVLNAFIHNADLKNPKWYKNNPLKGSILKWKDNCQLRKSTCKC